MIKIGCCGFPKKRELYFKEFLCVELQATFYQPPQLNTLAALRHEAPSPFEFAIKAWQIITHPVSSPTYRRLREKIGDSKNYGFFKPTPEVFSAYERMYEIARILEAKAILFQTPPSFFPTQENIKNMYRFFKKIKRDNFTFFWEERSGFSEKEIKKICRDLEIYYSCDPFKKFIKIDDLIYFRLHGRGGYKYKFNKEDLERIKKLVKGKRGYVFFNNVYMWEDALEFKKLFL
ncbi:MAG: hypothetical protein B6D56_00530 [Candidatus Omnitrophica bacterium 4484_70.1]|nr:MAG: hypothetical protein B6D56_00530 [Candidatus Omnitrophica bacterium 4484_70.1]